MTCPEDIPTRPTRFAETQQEIIPVQIGEIAERARALISGGGRMQMAYAWQPLPDKIELRYLTSSSSRSPFVIWACRPESTMPSLAGICPLLGWYEREIADLFGLTFAGHPEPQRLVLQEGAQPVLPPLDRRYPKDAPILVECAERYAPEVAGDDTNVQMLPFGPVRADVVESAEFLFFYIGEQILHYHPRLFFKHRGMEKRFEGLLPEQAVVLAERVSGVGSFSHALAYCQALEAAAGCTPPKRARWLRVLLAELERLYNHLHYLGHLADTTTLKVGQAEGKLLEERAKQLNARLTGSRFLRSLLVPGGLRRDLAPESWLSEALEELRHPVAAYMRRSDGSDSHLDRLITTGVLEHQVALDQGATGPVQRASGLDRDLRRDHPYAAYAEFRLTVPVEQAGDAYARFKVRLAEIDVSITLMQRLLLLLKPGPVRVECRPAPGSEGLGWCENPRGSLFYAVHIGSDGHLTRVKIKSPSFSNWRAFPFTVHDSNMMDYAINEASFGLTISGCAR
ncbi:MAG: NADH-quinone oxidoreductase subunit C [Xanthobacteraceae bacterium]